MRRGRFAGMMGHPGRVLAVAFGLLLSAPATAQEQPAEQARPDVDLYALMTGKCSRLTVAGRDFGCKIVAYFHSEKGRANFTVALDDPADDSHVISFSGEYGRRTQENLYVLAVDRMLLSNKARPKADGLPIPAEVSSDGVCRQLGKFASREVSSITCSASDKSGKTYELTFESDGTPITLRRIRMSAPTIRLQDPYR
jgi:hypothetical protein